MSNELARRTFIFGAATTAAAVAVPSSPLMAQLAGLVTPVPLSPRLPWRRVRELIFSSMAAPTGSDYTIQWTFERNGNVFYTLTMNARGTYRWVAIDNNAAVVLAKDDVLSISIDPCEEVTSLTMVSDIEKNDAKPGRFFNECFRWRGGKIELSSISPCDPRDEHVVA